MDFPQLEEELDLGLDPLGARLNRSGVGDQ
jgi:hypothetical protein